jgi:hypothetical protein
MSSSIAVVAKNLDDFRECVIFQPLVELWCIVLASFTKYLLSVGCSVVFDMVECQEHSFLLAATGTLIASVGSVNLVPQRITVTLRASLRPVFCALVFSARFAGQQQGRCLRFAAPDAKAK